MAKKEYWKAEPDPHDFPATGDYLSLLLPGAHMTVVVRKLRAAPLSHKKAKHLLRAGRLQLLPADDPDVARDLKKIRKGELLSPVLLVRGHAPSDVAMTIADGYHRICASYHVDKDAEIPAESWMRRQPELCGAVEEDSGSCERSGAWPMRPTTVVE